MNKEEFRKYLIETIKVIESKITTEEFEVINLMAKQFNKIFDENKKLQNDLNEVKEKIKKT